MPLARPVPLDRRALAAFGLFGISLAVPGTTIVTTDGTAVRVREDGGLDEVVQEGGPARGIGADPAPRRSA